MRQQPTLPAIGDDVTALMSAAPRVETPSVPAIGEDVSALMASLPKVSDDGRVRSSNAVDAEGNPVVAGETQPADDRDWTDSLVDFGRELWRHANPITAVDAMGRALIPEAVGEAIGLEGTGPMNAAKNIGAAHENVRQEAIQAFEAGDYITGSRKLVSWLIPLIGPALDESADKMAEGKTAEGLGAATGIGASIAAPAAMRNVTVRTPRATAPNPAEAKAVELGLREGINVDVGTGTGNRFVKGIQRLNDESLLGSVVADRAQQTRAQGLATLGEQLAAKGHTGKVTPEQAGAAVRQSLEGRAARDASAATRAGERLATRTNPQAATAEQAGAKVRQAVEARVTQLNDEAGKAYDTLRRLEERATPTTITTQEAVTKTTSDGRSAVVKPAVAQQAKLGVDLRPVRSQLEPLYKELLREKELVGDLQGGKGRTLLALDTLMNYGDDLVPLSVADAALGDLKAMSRTKGIPATRTPGQATAAQAVAALEQEVQAAASRGGPQVMRALSEGRAATRQKYAVIDTLESLADEPVKTVQGLIARKDAGIAHLRDVAKVAPQEMKLVARAVIDDLLANPDPAAARRAWAAIGPETRSALFSDPSIPKALDVYFREGHPRAAAATLKKLSAEPVEAFRQLTRTEDGGIERLRAVARLAPEEMPKIGRAFLDDLMQKATQRGAFEREPRLLAAWESLGKETKQLLFKDADYIADLDSFFLLAKKLGENPNPSGTALTLAKHGELGTLYVTGGASLPISIGSGVLAKILHSPQVTKALVKGLSMRVTTKSAASAAITNLMNVAKEAGLNLKPATYQDDPSGTEHALPAGSGNSSPAAAVRAPSGAPRR